MRFAESLGPEGPRAGRGAPWALVALLTACASASPTTPSPHVDESAVSSAAPADSTPLRMDFGEDVLRTALDLDLAAMRGTASITLRPPPSGFASLEIGDLDVREVTERLAPVRYAASGGRLDLDLRRGGPGERTVVVEYQFSAHDHFDGWEPRRGFTFLWPQFCGNLFPCKSDPTNGSTYAIVVSGVPAGETAIFPAFIPSNAPPYMPAIAVGAFTELDLGKTTAGTEVRAWHHAGEGDAARAGTKHLRDVFDFYERTYGPYAFGPEVGSVSIDWPPGAFGGMEHHPYWHVAMDAFTDEYTHAHEAASRVGKTSSCRRARRATSRRMPSKSSASTSGARSHASSRPTARRRRTPSLFRLLARRWTFSTIRFGPTFLT